ncbi:NLI interacting factor-like phosphatase [Nitzschia inconspicua]|uniref:Mitochondrial import inner membrane translocase subunit TIM50 n=1 Tax=Nitzschia inconspicua TaxID=303405 RepID=A0A9K3KFM4_9STRA|nr:NLI interacting factor-like phosphatase [Nitzschia inconspicua]
MTKKKGRYSRELKRERKRCREEGNGATFEVEQHQDDATKNPKKQRRKKLSIFERLVKCFNESKHTGSVQMDEAGDHDPVASVRIITGCDWNESKHAFPPDTTGDTLTLRVQPLLILDMNGILCHRSRHTKEPVGVQLRPSIGMTAQTSIIPRTELEEILRYLDRHFCLAIWTSAKRRTANRLLKMLLPPEIRQRLLFVWGQNYCQAENVSPISTENSVESEKEKLEESESDDDDEDNDDTVYEKRLDKVWKAFPLWSADNTLLMDDSPEKCTSSTSNAIHPPAIHGRTKDSIDGTENQNILLCDEENERLQLEFFQKLTTFWTQQPHLRSLAKVHKTKHQSQEMMSYSNLIDFLESNARRHFGWRSGNGI